MDPAPLTLLLGAFAVLVALFVSAAKGDLYGAVLWYQSPKIWVWVSAVRLVVLPLMLLLFVKLVFHGISSGQFSPLILTSSCMCPTFHDPCCRSASRWA